MVTRSEAIERIAKMVCFQGTPCVTCVEDAESYLDALLNYLEENQAHMLMFGGRVALGHALVSELVALLKAESGGRLVTEQPREHGDDWLTCDAEDCPGGFRTRVWPEEEK